jgi:dihydrofolate synthase/folylpolyglutamate synthase
VVTPEISVITSIGLDHTGILGNTLEEIAAEKAGIIKQGKPIVYFDQIPSVNDVIEKKASKNQSKIIKLSKEDIKIYEKRKKEIAFSVESGYHKCNDLRIRTMALYQLWNADLAIHAVKEVIPCISNEAIRTGLQDMKWPARMEEIEPHIILDGAHNPHAVRAWVQTVSEQFLDVKKDLLFAVVADKDYEEMISIICGAFVFEHITITCVPGYRKADPEIIKNQFRKYTDTEIIIEESVEKAYADAKFQKKDYLFCLGSLYLAGMIEVLV